MRFLLTILICCCASDVSLALSYGTPGSMLSRAMASNMDDLRQSGMKVPQTWEEMEGPLGVLIDGKYSQVQPRRRFVFITNDVRLQNERVLLMMRSPFRDVRRYTTWYGGIGNGLREPGRWVVLQDAQSVIRARYVSEDAVVAAFAGAGVPLPTPDGLGEWPHEVKHRQARNTNILLGCLAIGFVLSVRLALRGGCSNETPPPDSAFSAVSTGEGGAGAGAPPASSSGGSGGGIR